MALDSRTIQKPFRKLRKLLKNFSDPPAPEDVHDVRTQTRRIEAMAGAFHLEKKKPGGSLLKRLKPIRKAAGDVRDMDVLTDLTASLDPESDVSCRLKLMQHLAHRRTKAAAKLLKKANSSENQVRRLLKQCGKLAESGLAPASSRTTKEKDKDKVETHRKSAESMASSLQIEQELRDWPKLDETNIHPFRLKLKELRYVLQLGADTEQKLVDALGNVKDQIGLWHDWNELAGIADKVLDHASSCAIKMQIKARTKEELNKALDTATRLRTEYLAIPSDRGPKKKGVVTEIHPAVVKATSRLAS